jgi:acyl-CoA reductase-like NAD-dependent aldehyde dehydrogenase
MDCDIKMKSPQTIHNWIDGGKVNPVNQQWFKKYNPHNGELLSIFPDSNVNDVENAVSAAEKASAIWSGTNPVRRGQVLGEIVAQMKRQTSVLADCIAEETGKPPSDANGEVAGAILQAEFWAGEGMRMYGRSLTSGVTEKHSHTIRQPIGVVGLIVPANTPLANLAWKIFPALICGNTIVLKASEDAPRISEMFAAITEAAGLPRGVLNVVHGNGVSAGAAIVEHKKVSLISFTGSTKVGRWIAEVAGRRMARLSLELGGKNPLVVCDDADLDQAVHWAALSAFSNAGQRCAAGSRIIVFERIYEVFLKKLIDKAKSLKLGVETGDDLGPVITKKQQNRILEAIAQAARDGGKIHCGGSVPSEAHLTNGYYIQPTVIDGLGSGHELCNHELFGPVVTVHPCRDLQQALDISNSVNYGLTSAIHTRNVDRAMWYAQRVRAGVANVNMGTFGSEPHMPFGGFGDSGNGTREPGIEALDVYSETKNISFLVRPNLL